MSELLTRIWFWIRRILFWIWPPYEAAIAAKAINRELSTDHFTRMAGIQQRTRQALHGDPELEELESLAKFIFEFETRRKETLESKALAFVSAFGVSITIISALPVLFDKWNIPDSAAIVSMCFYGLAVLHLLVAIYHAVAARRVAGFAVPHSEEFFLTLQQNQPLPVEKSDHSSMRKQGILWLGVARTLASRLLQLPKYGDEEPRNALAIDRIVAYVSKAKFNEPLLTKKANYLAVAESMFVRGLAFVAIASGISAGAKLFS